MIHLGMALWGLNAMASASRIIFLRVFPKFLATLGVQVAVGKTQSQTHRKELGLRDQSVTLTTGHQYLPRTSDDMSVTEQI